MVDSLRARLLLWYTLILALVIAAFGGAVCYALWRSALAAADEALLAQATLVEQSVRPAAFGTFSLDFPDHVLRQFNEPSATRPYYAIWSGAGALIDQSDPDAGAQRPAAMPARWTRGNRREIARRTSAGLTVLVGRDITDLRQAVWSTAGLIGGAGVIALTISLVGGWFLSSRALAPIARISRTATEMSAGDLSARVPIDRTESELGQLASTLNEAFDRLQATVDRQRRFTADASHELRTPLASLSAEVEWALARERTAEEYHGSLEICWRAATRMRAVVGALLTLARADAGELRPESSPIALAPIVDEVVGAHAALAHERGVTIARTLDSTGVVGDPELLRTVVANLVSNAIQYNREGGHVSVTLATEDGHARLDVADTGIGIPADDVMRVFERFYRADKARARRQGGAGLGLALAKWIVDAHHGEISCASVVGEGTRFTVRLPRATA
jgi:two-component system, OmpR family, sensor kinase